MYQSLLNNIFNKRKEKGESPLQCLKRMLREREGREEEISSTINNPYLFLPFSATTEIYMLNATLLRYLIKINIPDMTTVEISNNFILDLSEGNYVANIHTMNPTNNEDFTINCRNIAHFGVNNDTILQITNTKELFSFASKQYAHNFKGQYFLALNQKNSDFDNKDVTDEETQAYFNFIKFIAFLFQSSKYIQTTTEKFLNYNIKSMRQQKRTANYDMAEWFVSGHWRLQPYGEGRIKHKLVFIEPHKKTRTTEDTK